MKFYKVQSEIALRPPRRRRGEKRGITRLKYVGIDYGLARTGLAVSDPEGRLAFPLVTLRLEEYPNRKDFLAALAARITAEEAEAVVMGLPLLDDGTDSLTTRQVRNVTERLKRRVDHGDMREQLPYGQVLSCGVLELGPDGFICSGGNNELGVKARPEEDAAIIAEALRRR